MGGFLASVLANAVIKAVLEWLTGLWDRFIQKQKNIEQGRQEVKQAIEKKEQEVDKELQKLRDTDTSFDDAINELRNRSNSGVDELSSNKTSNTGGG